MASQNHTLPPGKTFQQSENMARNLNKFISIIWLIPEEILANLGLAKAAKARIHGIFVQSHLLEMLKRVLTWSWYINVLKSVINISHSAFDVWICIPVLGVNRHYMKKTMPFLSTEGLKPTTLSIDLLLSGKESFMGKCKQIYISLVQYI